MKEICDLPGVDKLKIHDCRGLVTISPLSNVKKLEIKDCPNLLTESVSVQCFDWH
jgi:hypothetical protein